MKKLINPSLLLPVMLAVVFIVGCRKEVKPDKVSANPQANQLTPAQGPSNTTLTITGSGLADMRTIVFSKDSIQAVFNPTFNTDGAIVFRVPLTAVPGPQNIVLTNGLDKTIIVPFNVLGLAAITDVSDYNFTVGTQLTLTGKNLADVTKIALTGTTDEATIVTKTATSLVITMPSTTATSATLTITNLAGGSTTLQVFVNVDLAFKFFTDSYQNGEGDASWGDAGFVSTTEKKRGIASVGKKFAKGNWHNLGFGWNWIAQGSYKDLSFWIKGGLIDHDVWIFADSDGGPGHDQAQPANTKILVKAGVWQYFKISLSTLNLWADGTVANGYTINKLGWFLKGPDNADETLYLDDVMFIK